MQEEQCFQVEKKSALDATLPYVHDHSKQHTSAAESCAKSGEAKTKLSRTIQHRPFKRQGGNDMLQGFGRTNI